MTKMPKLYEGVILRETDRTDTMGHIEKLTAGFKLKIGDKAQQVDKVLEPPIKAVIKQDAVPNIAAMTTIEQVKKAQAELIKARTNVAVQQRQFGNGIKAFDSVKDIALSKNQSPSVWLSAIAKDSLNGDLSLLTDPADKARFNGTFQKQSSQLLAVIMGYSAGDSWANGAIADVKTADEKYVTDKAAGAQDLADTLRNIESSVLVFTALTGEIYDRLKKTQVAVEERGQQL